MAAWIYYAAQELSQVDADAEWINELANYRRENAKIAGGATMDAKFDEYVVDEIRHQIVLEVARRVLEKFLSFGEKIPVSVLESMHMSGTYNVHDAPAEGFLKTSGGLINLLVGSYAPDEAAFPIL
jgi:hypothetical protein